MFVAGVGEPFSAEAVCCLLQRISRAVVAGEGEPCNGYFRSPDTVLAGVQAVLPGEVPTQWWLMKKSLCFSYFRSPGTVLAGVQAVLPGEVPTHWW